MSDKFDTDAILAHTNLVELVSRYVELKPRGPEFVASCPLGTHEDKNPSFTVYESSDGWRTKCFACGEFHNAISFLQAVESISFVDACKKLTNGDATGLPNPKPIPKRVLKKPPERRTFAPPPEALPPEFSIKGLGGAPSHTWTYRTDHGAVIGYICRYDAPTGKEIRCWSWGNRTDAEPAAWACGHFAKPRPLYNLDRIAADQAAQVIVVEGEKTADAATRLFPQMVATTWPGGANAWNYADWQPLAGRDVILIPDADEPGRLAMGKLAAFLDPIVKRVRVIEVQTYEQNGATLDCPKGWDLADIPEWKPADAMAWAKSRLQKPPKNAPERDLSDSEQPADTTPPPDAVYEQDAQRSAIPRPLHSPNSGKSTKVAPTSDLIVKRGSDFVLRNIDWLWQDKIPLGKLTMIVGNPGLGKSQVTASLAAIVTTGGKWPVTRENAPQGSVLILSAEDDPEDTILPRLVAAGADTTQIYMIQAVKSHDEYGKEIDRGFDLSQDIARLILEMDRIGNVKLVIVDPVSVYMGKNVDSHNNSEVRGVLAPLTEAAHAMGAAIVLVSHLNKSGGQDALLRTQGSIAFVAACRAVFGVAKDKDNPQRRIFMPIKANLSTDETGFAYSVESHVLGQFDPPINTSRILWENETVNLSADEAFGQKLPDEERSALADAEDFLREILEPGSVKTQELQAAARSAGHAWTTVKRAKDRLKVVAHRVGGIGTTGQWAWKLPEARRGYTPD